MAINAVDGAAASAVNASYDQWYLHNLTNTDKVLQTKSEAKSEPIKSPDIQSGSVRRREDVVDFSESARQQALSLRASAQNGTENIADRIASEAKQQNAERISGEADGEKPDYRAISLIKNSAIEIPEYKPEENPVRNTAPAESSDPSREQLAAEQAQPVDNARSIQNAQDAQEIRSAQSEPNVIESGTEQLNATFEQPVRFAPENNANELKSDLTERIGERGSELEKRVESAEEKQSGSRVPPSQAKAIDSYKQSQLYGDSLNMSNAGTVA